MKHTICLLLMVCLYLNKAQCQKLNIGDTLPCLKWYNIINHSNTSITTYQFPSKWIILDFWATWCSSCTKSLNKLDSLQQRFSDCLQILLINPKESGECHDRVFQFWQKRSKQLNNPSPIPVITGDTAAFNHFSFRSLPHCIWIDPNGVIRAITGKSEVSAENILSMVQGTISSLPVKKDFNP